MAHHDVSASDSRNAVHRTEARIADPVSLSLAAGFALVTMLLLRPTWQDLTDGAGTILVTVVAVAIVFLLTPPLIRKMRAGGMVGVDVNKKSKTEIAELGGIAALFSFSISISVVVGLQKLMGNVAEPPFLAAIGVFFMASMIGLIDDISNLRQRLKAGAVAFAALPLVLVHLGSPIIAFPFGLRLDFNNSWHLFFWIILVPIGVTGVANAMNMSAGYNGLESGQIAVVSLAMIAVGQVRGVPDAALWVFGAVFGCSIALYHFNRFPARIFLGDIGTLGLGAALAAGIILAHIEFYGLVAIAPAFYEMIATAYFGVRGDNGNRRKAYRNPVIALDGTLSPPVGARRYTLAYWVLSRRAMSERGLVTTLLTFYAACSGVAFALSVL